jgi:hypothetical protein
MELQVMCAKWKLTSVHLEIMLISKQDRCTVCTKRSIGSENQFGCTLLYSYVMRFELKLDSVRLETVSFSTQDWCTVCMESAIGSEIILGALDGTTR